MQEQPEGQHHLHDGDEGVLTARAAAEDDQTPDHLEPGIIFDHGHYPPNELDAEIINLAWRLGWRGRDPDDAALIRNAMHAAGHGDPDPDPDAVVPASPRGFDPLDEMAVAENLTWAADDATGWLNDHYAPAGHWVGNDGEAGAFGVWEDESDVRNWTTAELREEKAEMVSLMEGTAEYGPHDPSEEFSVHFREVDAELTRRANQAVRP